MKKVRKTKSFDFHSPPHILLGITGSTQAEITPRLVANLLHHPEIGDHEVRVAATPSSLQFFSREEVEKLIKNKVFVEHSDTSEEFPVPHINLVEWADVLLVYPASANTIAKCANGICDTLVSNLVLTSECPVFFGPVMNRRMYEKTITQKNFLVLKKLGFYFIPQTMTKVLVKATGEIEEKLFCSEIMVLETCRKLFRARENKGLD